MCEEKLFLYAVYSLMSFVVYYYFDMSSSINLSPCFHILPEWRCLKCVNIIGLSKKSCVWESIYMLYVAEIIH